MKETIMNLNFRTPLVKALAAFSIISASAVLAGCGSSDAATIPEAAPTPTTVVLVHGAWADGSSWSKVTPLLQQRGLKVISVQLQRASLADDAAIVRRAMEGVTGQVVLVGHSYGGAVVTEAGIDAKVATLVYVDAFTPGDNESITDILSPYPAPDWQKTLLQDSKGYLSLPLDTYVKTFASDLPVADATLLSTYQGPIFYHVLDDKVTNAAWKTKPSFFVMGSNDLIIPPQFQQGEAARIKSTKVTTIPGASHISMVSHPTEVANVILDAVTSVHGL
jgi:pimeloyl-ACP methyl ester carboxylesterase